MNYVTWASDAGHPTELSAWDYRSRQEGVWGGERVLARGTVGREGEEGAWLLRGVHWARGGKGKGECPSYNFFATVV